MAGRRPARATGKAADKETAAQISPIKFHLELSISSSITDERPDVSEVYDYKNYEEYQAWVEAVEAREELSPSERQGIINAAPVPEETFEEALERHADD